jgi:hypothetical protein
MHVRSINFFHDEITVKISRNNMRRAARVDLNKATHNPKANKLILVPTVLGLSLIVRI